MDAKKNSLSEHKMRRRHPTKLRKTLTERTCNVLQTRIVIFIADGSLRQRKFRFFISWPMLKKRKVSNFINNLPYETFKKGHDHPYA